jgi:NADH dehydrogenase [ubiquinone] 1 alpha subcomplex assembly factor 1
MLLFDFSTDRAIDDWMPINDVVMGGVSTGRMETTGDGTAAFTGLVSLENGGGFASVRSRPGEHDFGEYSGLELRIRGDGRRYKINLETDLQANGILYRSVFETREGEWQTLRLPFAEFLPTFRGRLERGAPPLDLSSVTSLGLMISDRQAGPFRLEIARIGAYAD